MHNLRQRAQYDNRYKHIFAEARLRKEHLIFPIFVSEKHSTIKSMPGMSVTSIEKVADHIQAILDAGITSIIIFGIPKVRDSTGRQAASEDGIVQRATKTIKARFGRSINIITDVCVCQYNLTGHCGILHNTTVDNDLTLKTLAEIATSHAQAGADVVAPSSMMDGQVGIIKSALMGFRTKVLSYSAKHASSLYVPFRSAAFTKAKLQVDKSSYQVSYANPRQVLIEIETDINEGADMVMIKPALAYLDLISRVKDKFNFPMAAQNVSGEYAMIKAAAMRGWIDEDEWTVSSIASIKRAGADRIISYFSLDIARKYL